MFFLACRLGRPFGFAAPTAQFFMAFDSSKNRLARKSAGSEIRLLGTPSQRIFEPADFRASGIERALIICTMSTLRAPTT